MNRVRDSKKNHYLAPSHSEGRLGWADPYLGRSFCRFWPEAGGGGGRSAGDVRDSQQRRMFPVRAGKKKKAFLIRKDRGGGKAWYQERKGGGSPYTNKSQVAERGANRRRGGGVRRCKKNVHLFLRSKKKLAARLPIDTPKKKRGLHYAGGGGT